MPASKLQSGNYGGFDGSHAQDVYAKKGTTAYWPDGTTAGAATTDVDLGMKPVEKGGRRCFPAEGLAVPLCFDPANLSAPGKPPKAPAPNAAVSVEVADPNAAP